MGKRWDLVVSRKLGEKYVNTRVGAIFENENGNLSIKLDPGIAVYATEGATLHGFVPRPREDRPGQQRMEDFERF